jgi:hypothetical protein
VIFLVAQIRHFAPPKKPKKKKKVLRNWSGELFGKFQKNQKKKVLKSSRFLGDSGRFLAFFF